MSITIASSLGTSMSAATGCGQECHLIYAVNSGRWWVFYLTSTQTLATAYSSNFTTWNTGATLSLAFPHLSEGRNLSVAYANISSTDVVHIHTEYYESATAHHSYHVRATISGTTISFGTEAAFTATATISSTATNGQCAVCLSGDFHIGVASSFALDSTGSYANASAGTSSTIDAGSSWLAGWNSYICISGASSFARSRWVTGITTNSSNTLFIGSDGMTDGEWTDLLSSIWNGSTWSGSASVFGSSPGYILDNDWGVVKVSNTDVHVVARVGTNTYTHRRWNGSAWGAGSAVPTQNCKAASGIYLASDGTNVWMFLIDSAASNNIKYIKWTPSGWAASWSTLEATSQTRNYLTGYPIVTSNTIGLIWTQTNGSNFDLVGTTLSLVTQTFDPLINDPYLPWLYRPNVMVPY